MKNLAFLEATINSDDATTFVEENKDIIEFATRELDSLVEEETSYMLENIGSFVSDDCQVTYESFSDNVSDVVIEGTSIFGNVIASDLSISEKKELIEGYAHMIAMGDTALVEEAAEVGKLASLGGAIGTAASNVQGSVAAGGSGGATVGAAIGAGGGAAVGGAVAGLAKMLSKERKAWKALVAEEKKLKKQGAPAAKIKKIMDDKIKAKKVYTSMRNKAMKSGAALGAVTGAAGGAALGYVGTAGA